jgi:hypothetical protein
MKLASWYIPGNLNIAAHNVAAETQKIIAEE